MMPKYYLKNIYSHIFRQKYVTMNYILYNKNLRKTCEKLVFDLSSRRSIIKIMLSNVRLELEFKRKLIKVGWISKNSLNSDHLQSSAN